MRYRYRKGQLPWFFRPRGRLRARIRRALDIGHFSRPFAEEHENTSILRRTLSDALILPAPRVDGARSTNFTVRFRDLVESAAARSASSCIAYYKVRLIAYVQFRRHIRLFTEVAALVEEGYRHAYYH